METTRNTRRITRKRGKSTKARTTGVTKQNETTTAYCAGLTLKRVKRHARPTDKQLRILAKRTEQIQDQTLN